MPKTIVLWGAPPRQRLVVEGERVSELVVLTVLTDPGDGDWERTRYALDRRGCNELIEQLREARAYLVGGSHDGGLAIGKPIRGSLDGGGESR